ncbi:MAG: FAD-binding domain-containing protein [Burkholderiaceae bacterium]
MENPRTLFLPTDEAVQARLSSVHVANYSRTRNHLDGAVTYLSPYLTHGFLSLAEVVESIRKKQSLEPSDKLFSEFAWRAFFHHVWSHLGDDIFQSIRPGLQDVNYQHELPRDVIEARTGLAVIDMAVQTLYATGYLHNHARMWLASYLVHLRHIHWRVGADWLYGHLLDGDLASNHLSWQWVASTFSVKPYLFNAENVARYAPSDWHCPASLLDTSYEHLEAMARGHDEKARQRFDTRHSKRTQELNVTELPQLYAAPPADLLSKKVLQSPVEVQNFIHALASENITRLELTHAWSLRRESLASNPQEGRTRRLGFIHLPARQTFPWSARRWRFVIERLQSICDDVFLGDITELLRFLPQGVALFSQDSPGCLETKRLLAHHGVRWLTPHPLLTEPKRLCSSFSRYIREARSVSAAEADSS